MNKTINMDVVSVISTLDAYWTVIVAELSEIEKDLNHCYQLQCRYGSQFWVKSISNLINLKKEKENIVCLINAVLILYLTCVYKFLQAKRYKTSNGII
jgi:uncharacterized protein (UPF0335 family)